ncbi:ATP-binding protein, partial [Nonomuraea fuscirosea]
LPPSVDLAGYRILQEALTNALKHGESPVSVVLGYEPDQVVVRVDNALSLDRRGGLPGAGAGLIGMRERATLVGGRFEAGAADGEGWRVSVALPTTTEMDTRDAGSDPAAEKKNTGGGR